MSTRSLPFDFLLDFEDDNDEEGPAIGAGGAVGGNSSANKSSNVRALPAYVFALSFSRNAYLPRSDALITDCFTLNSISFSASGLVCSALWAHQQF